MKIGLVGKPNVGKSTLFAERNAFDRLGGLRPPGGGRRPPPPAPRAGALAPPRPPEGSRFALAEVSQ